VYEPDAIWQPFVSCLCRQCGVLNISLSVMGIALLYFNLVLFFILGYRRLGICDPHGAQGCAENRSPPQILCW
jgi:hypothetical protein